MNLEKEDYFNQNSNQTPISLETNIVENEVYNSI